MWAMNPGFKENEQGRELVGRTGQLLWKELLKVGIEREDCDIQNVMRCVSVDSVNGQLTARQPSQQELHCCSLYTKQAIEKSKATVHLVLGAVAATQLFGKNYPKQLKIFWSDKLRGRVVITYHPAYFLRGASKEKFKKFVNALKLVKETFKEGNDRFAFVRKQNYVGITDSETAIQSELRIRELAKKGRIAVDIEDDVVDGKRVIICAGFCGEPGESWVFLLKHPELKVGFDLLNNKKAVQRLLADKSIRKVLQRGTYDVTGLEQALECKFEGYEFDTIYGEYFRDSSTRSFMLEDMVAARLPRFAGWKELTAPYRPHLWQMPLKDLIVYNGADNDVTKRLELQQDKYSNPPLMQTYIDASFILRQMEKKGPLFDYNQADKLITYYAQKVERTRKKLQVLADDPEYNPGSPKQVGVVLYEKLGLLEEGRNGERPTDEETLSMIAKDHEFPRLSLEFRKDSKLYSTYLVSFKHCAELNDGRLATRWKETGTATGRMSSGGDKNKKDSKYVNFQNIIKDPQLQNMLLSDPNTKEFIKEFLESEDKKACLDKWGDLEVFLIFDYAQSEIRYLAQASGDSRLIAACMTDDVHATVGEDLGYERRLVIEDEDIRTTVKSMHFGIVYGLTWEGVYKKLIAEGVKTTKEKVKSMYTRYFKKYVGVKAFIAACIASVETLGFVENLWKFRRYLEVSEHDSAEAFWKNQAVNSGVQGGAHQVLFMVMALMKRFPERYKILGTPYFEVHDAFGFGIKLKHLRKAIEVGRQLMEKDVLEVIKEDFKVDWVVPFEAEAKCSLRLGTKVKMKGKTLVQIVQAMCEKSVELDNKLEKMIKVA